MINRIRDIRRQKGMTLADVAARCKPPTTAQTIGRLETGMRNLSLVWMNRIGAALEIEPELLVRGDETPRPQLIGRLLDVGVELYASPTDAIAPTELSDDGSLRVITVETPGGEYRTGDQVWLRENGPEHFAKLLNRDVLAPRPARRYVFGRLIDRDGTRVALLPPGPNKRQIVIENPPWLAVAEMLIRKL
jgi:transcriptional regulator with XRE-family HTH domain